MGGERAAPFFCLLFFNLGGMVDGWMDEWRKSIFGSLSTYAQSVFTNSNHRRKLRIQEKKGESCCCFYYYGHMDKGTEGDEKK
jgi:hypothetical protein